MMVSVRVRLIDDSPFVDEEDDADSVKSDLIQDHWSDDDGENHLLRMSRPQLAQTMQKCRSLADLNFIC